MIDVNVAESNENFYPRPEHIGEPGKRYSCIKCGRFYFVSDAQANYLTQKGWSIPTHCDRCRAIKKRYGGYDNYERTERETNG